MFSSIKNALLEVTNRSREGDTTSENKSGDDDVVVTEREVGEQDEDEDEDEDEGPFGEPPPSMPPPRQFGLLLDTPNASSSSDSETSDVGTSGTWWLRQCDLYSPTREHGIDDFA